MKYKQNSPYIYIIRVDYDSTTAVGVQYEVAAPMTPGNRTRNKRFTGMRVTCHHGGEPICEEFSKPVKG